MLISPERSRATVGISLLDEILFILVVRGLGTRTADSLVFLSVIGLSQGLRSRGQYTQGSFTALRGAALCFSGRIFPRCCEFAGSCTCAVAAAVRAVIVSRECVSCFVSETCDFA